MAPKIEIKNGTEKLTSNSGLAIVGAILDNTELKIRVNEDNPAISRVNGFSNFEILLSMIGLISMGKPDFDAIEGFREDPFFLAALGLDDCPSSPCLRQRLDLIGTSYNDVIKKEVMRGINRIAPSISPVNTSCGPFIPLDIDVSPFDNSKTKKEGVSRTYKGHDGYAPIFAYLGTEGYLVNTELREGKQHCQKNTPEFINETVKYARQITDAPILVRLDSGNDSKDNFPVLMQPGIEFIIKRNMRREPRGPLIEKAKATGTEIPCREGKRRWIGKTETDIHGKPLDFPIIFDVTERTIRKGQQLVFPEYEIDTYWCSLIGLDAKEVIHLYQDHGTSEQFHSELKTDMNIERLPSSRFSTNSLILVLCMLVYNVLRIIGQQSIIEGEHASQTVKKIYRKKVSRRRIRTVMQDMIYVAGRLIRRSRKWFLSLGSINPFADLWQRVYEHFRSNHLQLSTT